MSKSKPKVQSHKVSEIVAHPIDAKQEVVDALASLPDEAFNALAMAAAGSNIWADHPTGLTKDSQEAIADVRHAVAAYLEQQKKP